MDLNYRRFAHYHRQYYTTPKLPPHLKVCYNTNMKNNPEILYEDNHLLVVVKPANMPTQQDSSNDLDLVTWAKDFLKKKYNKPGNVYCGMVHRLDRPVSGIVVLAKTSKAASRLSNQIRLNLMSKKYTALVEGRVEPATWQDNLAKNQQTNTSYVTTKDKGKFSELTIIDSEPVNQHQSLITILLITGRSHQIRVQCASRNHPIVGDQRYHPNPQKNQQIHLLAHELSFSHPTTKENLTFKIDYPSWFLK